MNYFQNDYAAAREKFLAAAELLNFRQLRLRLPCEESTELFTDFAFLKRNPKKLLVHISGVHGVEGFAGSAIQCKILSEFLTEKNLAISDSSILFIHAVNPYGMAFYRRTNAQNVDLNRNYIENTLKNEIAINADYSYFEKFLNPKSQVSLKLGFLRGFTSYFKLGKARAIAAVASGQNKFPEGLFYSGKTLQREISNVRDMLRNHFPDLEKFNCIDLHTGLGAFPREFLFPEGQGGENIFERPMDLPDEKSGTYDANGLLSLALKEMFPKSNFFYVLQELGTKPGFKTLFALREENFAWANRYKNPKQWKKTQIKMLECFCPVDEQWRNEALRLGVLRFEQLFKQI